MTEVLSNNLVFTLSEHAGCTAIWVAAPLFAAEKGAASSPALGRGRGFASREERTAPGAERLIFQPWLSYPTAV